MTLRGRLIRLAHGADPALGHAGTRWLINTRVARFGEVKALDFDPGTRCILADILLRGESHAVRVNVASYEAVRDGGWLIHSRALPDQFHLAFRREPP